MKELHEEATAMAGLRKVEEVCRELGINPAMYHRWHKMFGGADLESVRELKVLKEENARLKPVVADQALDIRGLKELAEGRW